MEEEYLKRYAKEYNMPLSEVKNIVDNSSNPKLALDKEAFGRTRANLIKNPRTANILNQVGDVDVKNMSYMSQKDIKSTLKMQASDKLKDSGEKLYGFGDKQGWGSSVKQAQKASLGQRFSTFAKHANPVGASSLGSLGDTMGMSGTRTRAQAARGGLMAKISRRALLPGFGMLTAYDAMRSEDPLTTYGSHIAGGWGLQQGWRVGKAASDLTGPKMWKRAVGGGIGAVGFAAAATGTVLALGDLGRNDSNIAKKAKQFYRRETMNIGQDTRDSLTMRQAALRKLSSSSLNNRGQLLGNEANILKNAEY